MILNVISLQESSLEDDDVEWERLQTKITKRDKVLEGKSKLSHTVHCPYFPQVGDRFFKVKSYLMDFNKKCFPLLRSV